MIEREHRKIAVHLLRPGEISLANNGVIFRDEMPVFSVQAMRILRQPMEEGRVGRFVAVCEGSTDPPQYLPRICTKMQNYPAGEGKGNGQKDKQVKVRGRSAQLTSDGRADRWGKPQDFVPRKFRVG